MRAPETSPSRSARQTPLQRGQIRLFRLHAARNANDNEVESDPIRGDFVITNITKEDDSDNATKDKRAVKSPVPAYECLSYVWGDGTNEKTVTLDGEDVQITNNLYMALLHLRAAMPQVEGKKLGIGNGISSQASIRTLWIDALCINQENMDERSRQVGFMGSIYKGAERVIAFLGEAWDGHEMVFDYFELAAEQPEWHIKPSSKPFLQARGHDPSSPVLVNNLIRLFQVKWFSRVWIVQEFVNAKHVFFQLGQTIVDARRLHDGFLNIKRHIWSNCCGVQPWLVEPLPIANGQIDTTENASSSETIMTNVFLAVVLYEDLSDLRWERGSLSALDNLSIFRRGGCTDTRDRVYASFGLLPENATLGLSVDYTISANLVFTNVTFALIAYMQNLDVLSHIILQPQKCAFSPDLLEDELSNSKVVRESLASYVVDWSVPMLDSDYARYRSRMTALLGGRYHACQDTVAKFVPFNHPTMGVVAMTKGAVLDRIKSVGKTAAPDDVITSSDSAVRQVRDLILEARGMVGLPVYAEDSPAGENKLFVPPNYAKASEAEIELWRTLCANTATSREFGDHLRWIQANVEDDYDSYVQWWRSMILGDSQAATNPIVIPPGTKRRTSSAFVPDADTADVSESSVTVGGAGGVSALTSSSTGLLLPGFGVEGFEAAFSFNVSARRFIRTDGGRIGTAPREARPGDLVVLLAGGKVPYVLRQHKLVGKRGKSCCCRVGGEEPNEQKRDDQSEMKREPGEGSGVGDGVFYTFLGDAYVDGVMNGDGFGENKTFGSLYLK